MASRKRDRRLYSDHPAIALHESGHAYDINRRRLKGTYAFVRLLPFVDLYQEFEASDESLTYFIETGDRAEELRAYKILYPAFGSYAGNYMFIAGGSLIGTLAGHFLGRSKARTRAKYYAELDAKQAIEPLSASETPSRQAQPEQSELRPATP